MAKKKTTSKKKKKAAKPKTTAKPAPMNMAKPAALPAALDALGDEPPPEPEDNKPEARTTKKGKARYAHKSQKKCTAHDMRYPHHINAECGRLMKHNGYSDDGKVKYWKCKCGGTAKTVGEPL